MSRTKERNPRVHIHPALDLFAGTVAGVSALTVGFPLDTVKVRFQDPGNAGRDSITAPPLNGLVFAAYRFFMRAQLSNDNEDPTLTQITIAGAATGIIGAFISTPTELIKVHQQLLTDSAPHSRPLTASEVAMKILRQHGIRGLFRGITSTALRDSGYGAYFAAYEATLLYFPRKPVEVPTHDHTSLAPEATTSLATHSWGTHLLAGGIAGIAGWIVTFPFDVVKTRIQSTFPTCDNPYRNTVTTIIHSFRQEGPGVFFRGLMPTIIRAIPVNMVTFGTFEAVVHAFS